MAAACGADLAVTAIAGDAPLRAACATAGQLVVTTPAKLAQALREGILTPRMLQDRLQVLVLDEADLLLSYGCASGRAGQGCWELVLPAGQAARAAAACILLFAAGCRLRSPCLRCCALHPAVRPNALLHHLRASEETTPTKLPMLIHNDSPTHADAPACLPARTRQRCTPALKLCCLPPRRLLRRHPPPPPRS